MIYYIANDRKEVICYLMMKFHNEAENSKMRLADNLFMDVQFSMLGFVTKRLAVFADDIYGMFIALS